ncbi:MAG: DUF1697 domain-containing protein [Sphingobacterium composti]
MPKYVILLRAVNVSGKNILKMKDLKLHLEKANFHHVQTYIQSGNIILQSKLDKSQLKSTIQQLIQQNFGLSIDVFVLNTEDLFEIILKNPFPHDLPANKVYITLLDNLPEQQYVDKLSQIDFGKEQYFLANKTFYFYTPEGMANAKLSNPFIEAKLKVKATGRNLNTMKKLKNMAETLI